MDLEAEIKRATLAALEEMCRAFIAMIPARSGRYLEGLRGYSLRCLARRHRQLGIRSPRDGRAWWRHDILTFDEDGEEVWQ